MNRRDCLLLLLGWAGSAEAQEVCGVNGIAAAARLGVDGIGIELDPIYCNAANQWLLK